MADDPEPRNISFQIKDRHDLRAFERFEELVDRTDVYASRSEAIREATRLLEEAFTAAESQGVDWSGKDPEDVRGMIRQAVIDLERNRREADA